MISRRSFMLGAAAMSLGGAASANNTENGPPGPNFVRRKARVSHPAIIKQNCPYFCWAASISMIFDRLGHPLRQESIVASTFDSVICRGAPNTLTIAANLSRGWVDDNGVPFTSVVNTAYDPSNGINNLSNDTIIQRLSNDQPLLYATAHHAMVLVGVDYLDGAYGPSMQGGIVLDPSPYSPDWHYLTPSQFSPLHLGGEMVFLATVDVY
ncbi:hypothetical protein D9O50_12115 [Oxalobacteraceae bacterium CAVE-383]|nr:hypothetical protein D9O50_12115 [Oxalobacteraceae bacterium CAVE-383]